MWLWQWWRQVDCSVYCIDWNERECLVCTHCSLYKCVCEGGNRNRLQTAAPSHATSTRIQTEYLMWSLTDCDLSLCVFICGVRAFAYAHWQLPWRQTNRQASQPANRNECQTLMRVRNIVCITKNEWVSLFRVIKISMRACASFCVHTHTKCCGIFLFSFLFFLETKKKFSLLVSFFIVCWLSEIHGCTIDAYVWGLTWSKKNEIALSAWTQKLPEMKRSRTLQ